MDITAGDLEPLNGSVVFLSGQSDASINFTIMADDIPEINETLLLTLDRWGFIVALLFVCFIEVKLTL